MPSFFITYSICWQSVYIELLFMCISHLSWLWKNLEWKQGLQSRQWYLLKHISRWLQGAPQRRIQRQMTSPTPEVYALSCNVYISHIMHMVSSIAWFRHHIHNIEFHLLSLEIIHASARCLVYESIMSIVSCHPVYLDNMYANYFIPTCLRKTSYSFVMSSCLDTHHMLNYAIISC